jgi:hypothetical protein
VEQKKTTAENKKYEAKAKKSGARETDIQFIVRNFKKQPMSDFRAFVEFKAPGTDKITLAKPIKGGIFGFKGIELAPAGAVRLMAVSTNKGKIVPTGVTSYKLGKGKMLTFTALQGFKTIKIKAKTLTEMTKKAGLKGSLGLEFQILKVGGETFSEKEAKTARESEVEWEIQVATADFDLKVK